jgi:hypothetical protein
MGLGAWCVNQCWQDWRECQKEGQGLDEAKSMRRRSREEGRGRPWPEGLIERVTSMGGRRRPLEHSEVSWSGMNFGGGGGGGVEEKKAGSAGDGRAGSL